MDLNQAAARDRSPSDDFLHDIARIDDVPPRTDELLGVRLGRFQVVALLGRGGMGVVYHAVDEALRRDVALKVLPPGFADDEERRRRFLREARSAAAVNHPCIATIYEVSEAEGRIYIAMELVRGRTLAALLAERRLPVPEALRIARRILDGVGKAHEAGLIHRDLKPDNVMLTDGGAIKVLDFGLAKPVEHALSERALGLAETVTPVTTRGRVVGTPSYMSPEQARGEAVDQRSDVFSFGVMLYEMLAGRRPFVGKTDADVMTAILRDEPEAVPKLNTEVSLEVARVVERCLAKAPGERYDDHRSLAAELDRALGAGAAQGAHESRTRPEPSISNKQFQSGGTLRAGAVYVTRKADDELPAALLAGELTYVLAPRQMGKSSLRVRTEARLRETGVRCAGVDLSALGGERITADAWCFSIADELSGRLHGPDPSSAWKQHRRLPPAARLFRFVRRELLEASPEPMVIFFDEIDSVLSLSFPTDDFFATIRSVYNARAEDPACARLAFCFLGVATPADLMRNASRTPFNVGRGIRLEDFVRAQAQQLATGLGGSAARADAVLDVVFEWTEGHPYMAQRICEALAQEGLDASVPIRVQVARLVGQLFLQRGRVEDSSLAAMERLFTDRRVKKRLLPMLDLYARLLDNEHVVAIGDEPVQAALRLAGLAAERDDGATIWLQVRNPIVAAVFDHAWVSERRAWLSSSGTGTRRKPVPSARRER